MKFIEFKISYSSDHNNKSLIAKYNKTIKLIESDLTNRDVSIKFKYNFKHLITLENSNEYLELNYDSLTKECNISVGDITLTIHQLKLFLNSKSIILSESIKFNKINTQPLDYKEIKLAYDITSKIASKDLTKPSLPYVYYDNGILVATDSFQLIKYDINMSNKKNMQFGIKANYIKDLFNDTSKSKFIDIHLSKENYCKFIFFDKNMNVIKEYILQIISDIYIKWKTIIPSVDYYQTILNIKVKPFKMLLNKLNPAISKDTPLIMFEFNNITKNIIVESNDDSSRVKLKFKEFDIFNKIKDLSFTVGLSNRYLNANMLSIASKIKSNIITLNFTSDDTVIVFNLNSRCDFILMPMDLE